MEIVIDFRSANVSLLNSEIMFIDEKTQTKIYANLNESVIHATMRPQDLIPAFLDVIKDTAEYAQMVANNSIPSVVTDPSATDHDERWNSEDVSYFLNEELFYILDYYAPNGYYFGSHPGDGSDYGYWTLPETYEVCPYCEKEVRLPSVLGVHKCPNCGKYIVSCSMCDCEKCTSDCPHEIRAHWLNEHAE